MDATETAPLLDPATGESPATSPPDGRRIDKIVVAIHGIGSQKRSDTIRSVARRFGDREEPPLPVMPLGFFTIGKVGEVRVSYLDAPESSELRHVGFAEVFWADIPRQVIKDDDTLEETKAWGRSVVSRAQAAYQSKVTTDRNLRAEDFALAASVVEEIIETVSTLEKLLTVTDKMGVFKFDLAPLLRDYIGDVQIVADFKQYRARIVARFHFAMTQIVDAFTKQTPPRAPEIYIVAHSEGTVVSFLGLLQALSGVPVDDPEAPGTAMDTSWIGFVRGFMTIGSPIDKHLVLWEKMWEGLPLESSRRADGTVLLERTAGPALTLPAPIRWRNYYDFGDPIGFRLETAVAWLQERKCVAFEFETGRHDFGFSRYWLPGKAHNDYWQDAEVFGHFIDDVVMRPARAARPAEPPRNRPLVGIVSTAVPYLVAAALHFAAVLVLYKAVTAFMQPKGEVLGLDFSATLVEVVLLGLLLAAITLAARLPRLVKPNGLRWHLLAAVAFIVAALPAALWLPAELAEFLGQRFVGLARAVGVPESSRIVVHALIVVAALVSVACWWVPRRQARVGRRVLVGSGAVAVLAMVIGRLSEADTGAPAWPVVLAGAAFLYLWWLGILLFDLAFVWHRYIRQSVAVRTLAQWRRGQDAKAEIDLPSWGRKPPPPVSSTRPEGGSS